MENQPANGQNEKWIISLLELVHTDRKRPPHALFVCLLSLVMLFLSAGFLPAAQAQNTCTTGAKAGTWEELQTKLREGGCRDILTTVPPSRASAVLELLRRDFPDAGFTVLPQVLGRAFRIECDLFLDHVPDVLKETDERIFRAQQELLDAGAVFERPYGRLKELVYTDATATDAMRRLKRIFDPDNVLNPGRLCF